jgi:hypothetical protein
MRIYAAAYALGDLFRMCMPCSRALDNMQAHSPLIQSRQQSALLNLLTYLRVCMPCSLAINNIQAYSPLIESHSQTPSALIDSWPQ